MCGSFRMPEVVDDEERHRRQVGEQRLPRAVDGGVRDLLDEQVGFAIDDPIALLDRGAADGLGQMALAGARRAEEERVLALLDEARGGQLVDERAVHLLVEVKIKGLERAVGIAEAGEFVPAREEPVFAALQFVGDERGDRDRVAASRSVWA